MMNLSQLLPYQPSAKLNGELKKGLKEYEMLLQASKCTFDALKCGDLAQFDALVGENACQIRAVKIVMIASKDFATSTALQIGNAIQRIKELSDPKSLEFLMLKKNFSLKDLLEKEKLEVELTSDEVFLLQSFLLTQANTVNPPKMTAPLCRNDKTVEKNLIKFGDVTAGFTKSLVKELKCSLSARSVVFVRELAENLRDENLIKMCSKAFEIKSKGLVSIPMFWTYKTLLLASKEAKIPLVIYAKFLAKDQQNKVVNEECLFFKPSGNRKGIYYESMVPYTLDLDKPAIIVQGVVWGNEDLLPSNKRWKCEVSLKNVDIILAGAADHRQYPDQKKDTLIEKLNDEEYQRYKTIAKREGYCLENPGMFFIQHVYAAKVKNLSLLTQQLGRAERIVRAAMPGIPLEAWPQRAVTLIASYCENIKIEGEYK